MNYLQYVLENIFYAYIIHVSNYSEVWNDLRIIKKSMICTGPSVIIIFNARGRRVIFRGKKKKNSIGTRSLDFVLYVNTSISFVTIT